MEVDRESFTAGGAGAVGRSAPRGRVDRRVVTTFLADHAVALGVGSILGFIVAGVALVVQFEYQMLYEDTGGHEGGRPTAAVAAALVILVALTAASAFGGFCGAVVGIADDWRRVPCAHRRHPVWALVLSAPVSLIAMAWIVAWLMTPRA